MHTAQQADDTRRQIAERKFVSWTVHAFSAHKPKEMVDPPPVSPQNPDEVLHGEGQTTIRVTIEVAGRKKIIALAYNESFDCGYEVYADPDDEHYDKILDVVRGVYAAAAKAQELESKQLSVPAQPEAANDNAVVSTGLADLEAMTHPGVLVGDLVDWILSSSERPVRFLALAACLPFVGALMGRHYSGYRDCRSNHYTLGIMESGGGKDHARKQIKRLMMESSILQTFSGPGKFMSASALRNAVLDKPSCFCLMDEFGGTMRQMMDRKAGIHNQMIRDELLMMWSTADTFYEGAAYASTSAVKIFNPNLCFYGRSTPDDFWQSVTGLNSTDGLLPRMLLFNVPYDAPPRIAPARDVKGCPQTIVEACERLAQSCGGKSKIRRSIHTGSEQTDAVSVPMAPEAIEGLEEFKQ